MTTPYEPQNFEHLLGTPGFSEKLLKNHFTLYEAYVKNLNKLIGQADDLVKGGKAEGPEFGELKRRFGWEFNGVRLHELYFGNMARQAGRYPKGTKLARKLEEDFGAYESWEKEFQAVGAMRGIGWALLYYDTLRDRLWNVWVNEHDLGHFAGCAPLLVLDVFEHAFLIDYGVKKAGYIKAFFGALSWETVSSRFEEASLIAERNLGQARAA